MFSSRLRANGKGLIMSPAIPVSKPNTIALDFKTKKDNLQGCLMKINYNCLVCHKRVANKGRNTFFVDGQTSSKKFASS
jgi:hypothetical protein